jgi:hypothetical protein
VQELRPLRGGEPFGTLLDQPQPEVHMPEQPSLVGEREPRAGAELECAADVVQDGGCEQQVGAQTRMQLCRLAAKRGDADRVLEQASRI